MEKIIITQVAALIIIGILSIVAKEVSSLIKNKSN